MIFRRRAAVLYDLARERIAIVNADFQESLSGVRESQAFVHEAQTKAAFTPRPRLPRCLGSAAQRLVPSTFPFVQFLSGVADAIVLGVGAGLVASGHLTSGALIAFILYIDLFFSPIQQLSQVFDSWQQTRVSVGRIAELMALETLHRRPRPPEPGRLSGEIASRRALRLPGVDTVRAWVAGPSAADPPTPELPRRPMPAPKPPEALRGVDLDIAVRARRSPSSARPGRASRPW